MDELEIRRLPREAGAVIDELQMELSTYGINERHSVFLDDTRTRYDMHRQHRWLLALSFLLSLVGLTACGPKHPNESEAHALYREIQMHESRAAALRAVGEEQYDREAAASIVCDSADAICSAAKKLDEEDARERCRRAERECRAALDAAR